MLTVFKLTCSLHLTHIISEINLKKNDFWNKSGRLGKCIMDELLRKYKEKDGIEEDDD